VCLDVGDELHLLPMQPAQPIGTLSESAEAVLRLFYSINRGAYGVTAEGKVTLNDLRAFPRL
jgi:hypothetical protein